MSGEYEAVIGLEIHAQLKTQSKIFSSDSTSFGAGDNENISVVSVGLPGTLPVLNQQAVELAVKTGLALNCSVRSESVFARKNYFYPDLPKGYQISQYDKPICEGGYVEFEDQGEVSRIRITRAHLEEDAGKSTHHGEYSLINYNRAGVPLLEIVSAPDLRSPQQAAAYARMIRTIVTYLDACDGNLEEGSLRCDCNVSIRKSGETEFGTRVEIKNINSFRFIEKAIAFEIQRQIDSVETGVKITQETRLYDSAKNKTFPMRSKEDEQDYRYFPDPDLLPLKLEVDWVNQLKGNLPELPLAKKNRFISDFHLSSKDAEFLVSEKPLADYYEKVAELSGNPKSAAAWVTGDLMSRLNDSGESILSNALSAEMLAELITLIDQKTITGKMAKAVFAKMWESGATAKQVVERENLTQISDKTSIQKIVDEVLQEHPEQVQQYRDGKTKVFGFFVGAIMKKTRGQASPDIVNQILKEALS